MLGWLLALIVLVRVVVLIWASKRAGSSFQSTSTTPERLVHQTPDILKKCRDQGEIDAEQYERMKQQLAEYYNSTEVSHSSAIAGSLPSVINNGGKFLLPHAATGMGATSPLIGQSQAERQRIGSRARFCTLA